MKQTERLFKEAARYAKAFSPKHPKVRPEFVIVALANVRQGFCERICDYILVDEPNFQAQLLDALSGYYEIALPEVIHRYESVEPSEVPLDQTIERCVRAAMRKWRASGHHSAVPLDLFFAELLGLEDEIPILDLCLLESSVDRASMFAYAVCCSRHLQKEYNVQSVSVRVFDTFEEANEFMNGQSATPMPAPKPSAKIPKVAEIERILGQRIIGQPEAINAVMRALKKHAAGLKEDQKPIGLFLFAGPTGVGKTELTKALADATKVPMRRFDMSEYQEAHTALRLYGAPPSYVGYGDGGQLTDFVSKNPKSIVLFDEIEKAHPDISNVLLQIAEEGTLTDGQGKIVNFANVLIVLTTNIGSEDAAKSQIGFNYDAVSHRMLAYNSAIKKFFRPELCGRFTDIVVFNELSPTHIKQITLLELAKLGARLTKNRSLKFVSSPSVVDFIANSCSTQKYGAREIKTVISRKIDEPLADLILASKLPAGAIISVAVNNGELSFHATP